MCGIFCYFHKLDDPVPPSEVVSSFLSIEHRGPDNSCIEEYIVGNYKVILGFHRLAIVDNSPDSNQPITFKRNLEDLVLICNGEIYNYKAVIDTFKFDVNTKSDCEVILHLYSLFTSICTITDIIDNITKCLDGVYSFVLLDKMRGLIFSTRDFPIGVRPLFYIKNGFSSELKALQRLKTSQEYVKQTDPRYFHVVDLLSKETASMDIMRKIPPRMEIFKNPREEMNIFYILEESVFKRLHADRPLGCLLSGGLDSSIIACMVQKNLQIKIPTFCISMEGSDSLDAKYAERLARDKGMDHHSVTFTFEQGINILPDVIKQLETYDTTTIRASVPMYLLASHIKKNTNIKVIFSGEGADELFGGYLYFHSAPDKTAFLKETRRLQSELYMFDGLRADRCISAFGLELRVPFLDQRMVSYVNSTPDAVYPERGENESGMKVIEKKMLREAAKGLVPSYILSRQKDAFSDAVGESWVSKLSEYTSSMVNDADFDFRHTRYPYNTPKTKEEYFYRVVYDSYYPGVDQDKVIPHYWMPKWSDPLLVDPSARKLTHYSD